MFISTVCFIKDFIVINTFVVQVLDLITCLLLKNLSKTHFIVSSPGLHLFRNVMGNILCCRYFLKEQASFRSLDLHFPILPFATLLCAETQEKASA